jgi:hypothetical protein
MCQAQIITTFFNINFLFRHMLSISWFSGDWPELDWKDYGLIPTTAI